MKYENLIWLRENKLKKTQKELAIELGTTQDMISKIENNQVTPSIEILKLYSKLLGARLSDLLEFIELDNKEENYNNIRISLSQSKYNIEEEKNVIESNFNQLLNSIKTDYLKQKLLNTYNIIENINESLINKPKVVFLGLSDSGKSSAINYFLGRNILKVDWTPMTSSLIMIKHVSDKPLSLDINDNVLIFTQKSNVNTKWIEKNVLTKEKLVKDEEKSTVTKKYLKGDENFNIQAGDFSLLKKCNRISGNIFENIAMAVVYLESELLEVCDIVDTPGLTSEFSYDKDNDLLKEKILKDAEKDNVMIENALKIGDVFIFMNQINKFNDSNVNKLILDSLKNSESNPRKIYNFLLASQSDIVKNAFDRDKITDFAKQKLVEEYKEFKNLESITENFYSFSTIDSSLNKEFVSKLSEILTQDIPEEKHKILLKNKGIILKNIEDFLKIEEKNLGDQKNVEEQIKVMESSKNEVFKYYESRFKDLELFLKNREDMDINEFRRRIENIISVEKIHSLIINKNYSKKDVKNFLGRDIEQIYEAEINLIIKSTSEIFDEKIKNLYSDFQEITMSKFKEHDFNVNIPFDFVTFFASAVGGLRSITDLGFWNDALGNLGKYIFRVKGLNIFSTFNFSFAQALGIRSFTAGIGIPLIIGVFMELVIMEIINLIFGSTWQRRVSKEMYKKICEIELTEKFIKIIQKKYKETYSLCKPLLKNLKEKYEVELENLYIKKEDYNIENIEQVKKDIEALNNGLKLL